MKSHSSISRVQYDTRTSHNDVTRCSQSNSSRSSISRKTSDSDDTFFTKRSHTLHEGRSFKLCIPKQKLDDIVDRVDIGPSFVTWRFCLFYDIERDSIRKIFPSLISSQSKIAMVVVTYHQTKKFYIAPIPVCSPFERFQEKLAVFGRTSSVAVKTCCSLAMNPSFCIVTHSLTRSQNRPFEPKTHWDSKS